MTSRQCQDDEPVWTVSGQQGNENTSRRGPRDCPQRLYDLAFAAQDHLITEGQDMKILQSILSIQREIHAVGIGKNRRNASQGFNFRGIDDALMAFAPLLTQHSVILAPSYSDIVMTERDTAKGGKMYNVTLAGRYRFTHAEDGSTHEVGPFYGEASDSGDKAVSKAESVAERQMFFLSFVVPHEAVIGGDPDMHGEPVEDEGALSWLDAINAAQDSTELDRIGAELKAQAGTIAADAMKRIRAAWAARAKTVKVHPASSPAKRGSTIIDDIDADIAAREAAGQDVYG